MKIVLAGIAASVTILIGVFFLLQQPESEIVAITQKNQTTSAKKIILEDGNIVWLNKNTTITYFNKTNPYYNIIDIKGEAYFEILNPKIFNYQVLAHNAMIQIESPSSFNVKAFETSESIDITVNSGAITVLGGSHEGGLGLLVTQGNYCSVHKTRNLAFSSVNKNDNYLAWKTGKLVFERLPMATVTEVLSEYYNVKIDYENKDLAYCEFSGHFEEKSIEFILDKIKTELNFNIHSSENVITFSGSNCL